MPNLQQRRWRVLAILSTLGVLVGGSVPGGGRTHGISFFDKIEHFFVFGALAVFWLRGTWGAVGDLGQAAWRGVWIACLIGAGLEVWQLFLPYRSAEVLDFVADAAGAALFVGVAYAWLSRRALPAASEEP